MTIFPVTCDHDQKYGLQKSFPMDIFGWFPQSCVGTLLCKMCMGRGSRRTTWAGAPTKIKLLCQCMYNFKSRDSLLAAVAICMYSEILNTAIYMEPRVLS